MPRVPSFVSRGKGESDSFDFRVNTFFITPCYLYALKTVVKKKAYKIVITQLTVT